MKKLLFLLVTVCFAGTAMPGGEGKAFASESMSMVSWILPADMYFKGSIGGDENCELFIDCKTNKGYYTFMGMKRNVKIASYNKKTKKLVVNAYNSKGAYIGKFDGRFTYHSEVVLGIDRGSATYKGTFTNTSGGQVSFDLMDFWD